MHTFHDGKFVYSVDMLITWANQYQPPVSQYDTYGMDVILDNKIWSTDDKHFHSPNMVLADPRKYPGDMRRIKSASLKYPILVHGTFIVDGMHRITRAYLDKKSSIAVIEVPKHIMDLARIPAKVVKTPTDCYYFMDLYFKRFTPELVGHVGGRPRTKKSLRQLRTGRYDATLQVATGASK